VYRILQMENEDTVCERKGEFETGKLRERQISEIKEDCMVLCRQTELQSERCDDKGENKETSRPVAKKLRKTKRKVESLSPGLRQNSRYLPFPVSSKALGVSGIPRYALGTVGGVWSHRATVTASLMVSCRVCVSFSSNSACIC
jgi:hypothetical protein